MYHHFYDHADPNTDGDDGSGSMNLTSSSTTPNAAATTSDAPSEPPAVVTSKTPARRHQGPDHAFGRATAAVERQCAHRVVGEERRVRNRGRVAHGSGAPRKSVGMSDLPAGLGGTGTGAGAGATGSGEASPSSCAAASGAHERGAQSRAAPHIGAARRLSGPW